MDGLRERGRDFDPAEQVKGSPQDEGAGACAEDVRDERDPHTEKQLDHGLKETFPASDPVSINPGAD